MILMCKEGDKASGWGLKPRLTCPSLSLVSHFFISISCKGACIHIGVIWLMTSHDIVARVQTMSTEVQRCKYKCTLTNMSQSGICAHVTANLYWRMGIPSVYLPLIACLVPYRFLNILCICTSASLFGFKSLLLS